MKFDKEVNKIISESPEISTDTLYKLSELTSDQRVYDALEYGSIRNYNKIKTAIDFLVKEFKKLV